MSIETVKSFYNKMENDASLVEQVQQSQGDGLDALVAVAKENGYEFNRSDLEQFYSSEAGAGAPEAEMSDQQLEAVAGGGWLSFGGTCNTAICTITKNNKGAGGRCDISISGKA